MIEIVIVDDHPIARHGLQSILANAPDMRVTQAMSSPAELVDAASDPVGLPDVVLLDLYHGSDLPCLEVITQLRGATRVLVVSASGVPADVLGGIQAGAAGYLTKHAEPEMLIAAVRTVAAGGFALSSSLADILQTHLGNRPESSTRAATGDATASARPVLSPREEQTLTLIAEGFTHRQAADRMGLTKTTVDTYVERVRAKLQVGNKAELTRASLHYTREATRSDPPAQP